MEILRGKELADSILADAKVRIAKLKKKPKLAVVLVGSDPASETYVAKKLDAAKNVGADAELFRLPSSCEPSDLHSLILKLNDDPMVTGFIIQLPVPKQIDPGEALFMIKPEKDVDGLHPLNLGCLLSGKDEPGYLSSATPSGIIRLLERHKVKPEGKHAVVIGRSNIVGKPIAVMLLNRDATVTMCHSRTRDLASYTRQADILVVAVGKQGIITADMVKTGAYVIDVGTTKGADGKLKGDVDFENVIKKAHCTPVPGGAGPLTVSMLISNLVKAAELQQKRHGR
ncbi:MAG: bifunctional 5,10-methylenetetrahydrofolate dehydrogenase/5,10-methenyltetrahydrofolate cyclohydrolase [Candidatus Bilamarchaeaceae archaeon]